MKAILILAGSDSSNSATDLIWNEACNNKGITLTTLDSTHNDGQKLSSQLNVKSFPALIIDNKIVAVGHPDKQSAACVKIIRQGECTQ